METLINKKLVLAILCLVLSACGSSDDPVLPDADGDTIPDAQDNCIQIANPDQLNTDGDSAGDACDALPNDETETLNNDGDAFGDNIDPDDDNDSTPDIEDAFPFDATEQFDIDKDGIGDNKDLDLTQATGSNPKSIQISRLLETGRATTINNKDGVTFNGVMTSVGDVNHDGYDDLGVAYQENTDGANGYVYIIFGQQGGWPSALDLNDFQSIADSGVKYIEILPIENYLPEEGLPGMFLGRNIAALGDVNADGIDDFSITKSYDGNDKDETLEYKNNYPGEVMIVFGREKENWVDVNITVEELKAEYAYSIYGSVFNGKFGESIRNAGDVNGDNINDILISEKNWEQEGGPTNPSRIHVLFGSNKISIGRDYIEDIPLLSTVAQDYGGLSRVEIYGNEELKFLGYLKSIGDMNGDGLADFSMKSIRSDEIFVIWGKTTQNWNDRLDIGDMTPSDGLIITGLHGYGTMKTEAAAGDLNGDGSSDLVVTSSGYGYADSEVDFIGRVYILWGARGSWPLELDVTSMSDFYGGSISDVSLIGKLGSHVAILPDTNGDGSDELLIGKEYDRGIEEDDLPSLLHSANGNVFKVMGRSDWNADYTISEIAADWFQGMYVDKPLGGEIDVSGDFNGDGRQDMIFSNQYKNVITPEGFTSESYIVYGYDELYPRVEL